MHSLYMGRSLWNRRIQNLNYVKISTAFNFGRRQLTIQCWLQQPLFVIFPFAWSHLNFLSSKYYSTVSPIWFFANIIRANWIWYCFISWQPIRTIVLIEYVMIHLIPWYITILDSRRAASGSRSTHWRVNNADPPWLIFSNYPTHVALVGRGEIHKSTNIEASKNNSTHKQHRLLEVHRHQNHLWYRYLQECSRRLVWRAWRHAISLCMRLFFRPLLLWGFSACKSHLNSIPGLACPARRTQHQLYTLEPCLGYQPGHPCYK